MLYLYCIPLGPFVSLSLMTVIGTRFFQLDDHLQLSYNKYFFVKLYNILLLWLLALESYVHLETKYEGLVEKLDGIGGRENKISICS